ncbi:class I SAM-dependent methyltransferase [Streptomyces sp. NEAU-YJ-81]|uniref:class I SAM-dependent methyltransferase n=1 Tax=Streptomyces sp. NEAU-YJ-81 TaxID=2820288 RepID=UPI001ABD3BFA|nr:class I SAM-dependent methyltransferase [Streptomyces sp. NEAU-YJ-81]MBO3677550.1 methyltransferase domain-containing protein [Streptomyces sp. NEAU-YJ-81]
MAEADFLNSTRASYNAIALDYDKQYRDELAAQTLERAVFAGFAELVRNAGGGPVADVGSGPGRVTAHLHELGLSVYGIDLSPAMVELARREHPGLRFEEGSMLSLDIADGTLTAVVAWYSTIHIPQERLPDVFAEFHRVLAPGGYALVGFQVGDEQRVYTEAFGHEVSLSFRRWQPDRIAELLAAAGLPVRARTVREPERWEPTPQAFLIARKPPLPPADDQNAGDQNADDQTAGNQTARNQPAES